MMIRLLAVFMFFSSFTGIIAKDAPIPWNKDRKLTWADFKARPDNNSENAALTSSGIAFGWGYDEKGFSYTITCTFDPTKSWGRVKNDLILAHEQGHFDITEIYARKLKQALTGYTFNEKTAGKDIGPIYSRLMNEHVKMQADYDRESDHSRKAVPQQQWLVKIARELEDLKAYSNY
jgi:hypothetical protein